MSFRIARNMSSIRYMQINTNVEPRFFTALVDAKLLISKYGLRA